MYLWIKSTKREIWYWTLELTKWKQNLVKSQIYFDHWNMKSHTHTHIYNISHNISTNNRHLYSALVWGVMHTSFCLTTVWKIKSSTTLSMGTWFTNLKFRICFKLVEREILINIVNFYHLACCLMCSSIPACNLSELEGLDISKEK